MAEERSSEPPAAPPEAFSERLQGLKANGSAVLVVGSVPPEVSVHHCRRLLGTSTEPPRRRLFVFTNGTFDLASRLPQAGPVAPGSTEVITAATTRSAAAQVGPGPDVPAVELGEAASLPELGIAISEAIERFEARHAPLEPAEVRLCLDSLSPLLDAYGEQATFEFLAVVAARVRSVTGMAHVHLPVERDARVARLLAQPVDAVVEVRVRGDEPQQRWHLDGLTSGWLSC